MVKMNFKVGDKVRVVGYGVYTIDGMEGIIKTIKCDTFDNTKNQVDVDIYVYGVINGIPISRLKKIENKNITKQIPKKNSTYLPKDVREVIINNNSVVVVLEDGRKGISKCSEEDTFDTYCGFVNAYYRAKNDYVYDLKKVLNNCVKSANKKGYKQAILKNYD